MPDKAELWLMKNDPQYKKKDRNSKMEYPYLSYNQVKRISYKEIVVDNFDSIKK